jgi:hypothetical protein
MVYLAVVFAALSAWVATGNIVGCDRAYRRRRKGQAGSYSNVPVLSLGFGILGCILGYRSLGLWPLVPCLLDPGTWMLLYTPVGIWLKLRKDRKRQS